MTITCSVEQVRCNLCGASESAVLCGNDSFNMHLSTVMCRHCGLVYTSPRPTPEAYRRFYRTEFRRFYEDVATPDEWFLEYHDIERVAADRVRAYKSVLSDAKSVLEVGCETGAFLAAVRGTFPVVAIQGLEPAEQFAQFATAHYDVPVMACFLEDNRLVEGAYDVVAMFHVLEHSLDPTRALLEARRLLTHQGRLLIEVPNIRADWHGLGMLHVAHTYAFSPRTLSLLLTKCGFDVVDLNDSAEQPVEVSMSVT